MNKQISNISLLKQIVSELGYTVSEYQKTKRTTIIKIVKGRKFFLADANTYGFYPQTSRWHAALFKDKFLTQKILKECGYNVIDSVQIDPVTQTFPDLLNLTKLHNISFPVILKPNNGMKGRGVLIVNTEKALKEAYKTFCTQEKKFLIQPIIEGDEYRILVLNGSVIALQKKEYPSLIGDGITSIKKLLKKITNEEIDRWFLAQNIKRKNLRDTDILKKDQLLPYHPARKNTSLLQKNQIITADNIPIATKKWSEKLSKDINCPVIGIDIFVTEKLSNTKDYTIIELNANPAFSYFVNQFHEYEIIKNAIKKMLREYC